MMKLNTNACIRSTQWTIVFITILTLGGEVSKPLEDFLTALTGHHWVTKSISALVFFVAAYLALARMRDDEEQQEHYAMQTIWTVVLAGMIIFVFFVWQFLA